MSEAGRPTKFCPEMVEKIIEGVRKVLVMRQVAGYAEIHYTSLYNWLNQGKEDILADNYTEYAKFFYAVKKAQCEEVIICLQNIKDKVPQWQSQAWILERCFREDFGQEAGIIQEILDKHEKLEQSFRQLNESQMQGAVNDG